MKIGAVAALSVVVLAACGSTQGRWERANTSSDDVAAAEVECRDAARADTEQRLRNQGGGTFTSGPSSGNRDQVGTWTGMMDQFSAEKRERQVFERCMTQQGFQFVPFTQ